LNRRVAIIPIGNFYHPIEEKDDDTGCCAHGVSVCRVLCSRDRVSLRYTQDYAYATLPARAILCILYMICSTLHNAIYSGYFVCTVIGKQGGKKKKVTPEVLLFKKIKISLHSHTWKKTIKISPF
jgi:hypothetical protein